MINTLQHIILTNDTNSFLLAHIFDPMDVAEVNSFIIYDKLHPNGLSCLDFKLVVSKSLIGSFATRIREFWSSCLTERLLTQVVANELQSLFPEYQQTRRSCAYCLIGGIENHTFVMCVICDTPLYQQKEKKRFLIHHQHTRKWTNSTNWRPQHLVVKFILFYAFLVRYFKI